MQKTLVLQSHNPLQCSTWIESCLNTVRHWSMLNQFDYHFMGDELFDCLSDKVLQKVNGQTVIASDLARLKHLQSFLQQGYQRVIWFDADVLIFKPEELIVSDYGFAVGREVWVQEDKGKCRVYKKVHNAFLMFCEGNAFLDFYAESAERLLLLNQGTMSPQFIGPKLLTALHNIVSCPVIENVAMLSPLVIRDLIDGSGLSLDLFCRKSMQAPAAANLCQSSIVKEELNERQMEWVIERLMNDPECFKRQDHNPDLEPANVQPF